MTQNNVGTASGGEVDLQHTVFPHDDDIDNDPFAMAKELHHRLDPHLWSITKQDLNHFEQEVRKAWHAGEIPDNPDYPNPSHGDPTVGPNMYAVVEHVIKPMTKAAGGMSYALMRNPDGLPCDIFVTHAWSEGVFEFINKVRIAWPPYRHHLWCCFLANPQNLDISELLNVPIEDTPFGKAIGHSFDMIVVPTRSGTIYGRLWCVLEAYLGGKWKKRFKLPVTVKTSTIFKRMGLYAGISVIVFFAQLWLLVWEPDRILYLGSAPMDCEYYKLAAHETGEIFCEGVGDFDSKDWDSGLAESLFKMPQSEQYLDSVCATCYGPSASAVFDTDLFAGHLVGTTSFVKTIGFGATVVKCKDKTHCSKVSQDLEGWPLALEFDELWPSGRSDFQTCGTAPDDCTDVMCGMAGPPAMCHQIRYFGSHTPRDVDHQIVKCLEHMVGVVPGTRQPPTALIVIFAVAVPKLAAPKLRALGGSFSRLINSCLSLIVSACCGAILGYLHNLLVECNSYVFGPHGLRVYRWHSWFADGSDCNSLALVNCGLCPLAMGICFWPIYVTLRRQLKKDSLADEAAQLTFTTVRDAKCFSKSDAQRIWEAIGDKSDEVDETVRIVMEAGRYSADLRHLYRRGEQLGPMGIPREVSDYLIVLCAWMLATALWWRGVSYLGFLKMEPAKRATVLEFESLGFAGGLEVKEAGVFVKDTSWFITLGICLSIGVLAVWTFAYARSQGSFRSIGASTILTTLGMYSVFHELYRFTLESGNLCGRTIHYTGGTDDHNIDAFSFFKPFDWRCILPFVLLIATQLFGVVVCVCGQRFTGMAWFSQSLLAWVFAFAIMLGTMPALLAGPDYPPVVKYGAGDPYAEESLYRQAMASCGDRTSEGSIDGLYNFVLLRSWWNFHLDIRAENLKKTPGFTTWPLLVPGLLGMVILTLWGIRVSKSEHHHLYTSSRVILVGAIMFIALLSLQLCTLSYNKICALRLCYCKCDEVYSFIDGKALLPGILFVLIAAGSVIAASSTQLLRAFEQHWGSAPIDRKTDDGMGGDQAEIELTTPMGPTPTPPP